MSTTSLPGSPMMRALLACIEAGVPALLWGKPGVAKTATLTALSSKSLGRHCEVVVGSIRDATDFAGLPIQVGDAMHYAPPAWAKRLAAAPKGLAFLDELTTASGSVMKAMLRVIEERWVGDLQLPSTVSIVAAANPVGVAVDGVELSAPIANRFCHLDWEFDSEGWLSNMASDFQFVTYPSLNTMLTSGTVEDQAFARGVVTGFLRSNFSLIEPAVPENLGTPSKGRRYGPSYAYPSPRSWTKLASALAFLRRDDMASILLLAEGCVGFGAAIEFMTWYQAAGLYDPAEVLSGAVQVDWKGLSPDRLFALSNAMVSLVLHRGNVSDVNRALEVLTQGVTAGRKDTVVPAVRQLLSRPVEGTKVPREMREGLRDISLFALAGK